MGKKQDNGLTNTDILKKGMIEAMESSLAIVTTACKAVGISRDTHYRWMKEDEEYAAAIRDLENVSLDFAESKLMEKIRGVTVSRKDGSGLPVKTTDGQNVYRVPPSDTAIIFYLKTKGKGRGYIEQSNIGIKGTEETDPMEYVLPDGTTIKM